MFSASVLPFILNCRHSLSSLMVMASTETTSAHALLMEGSDIFSKAAFMVSKCGIMNFKGFGTDVMDVVDALMSLFEEKVLKKRRTRAFRRVSFSEELIA